MTGPRMGAPKGKKKRGGFTRWTHSRQKWNNAPIIKSIGKKKKLIRKKKSLTASGETGFREQIDQTQKKKR